MAPLWNEMLRALQLANAQETCHDTSQKASTCHKPELQLQFSHLPSSKAPFMPRDIKSNMSHHHHHHSGPPGHNLEPATFSSQTTMTRNARQSSPPNLVLITADQVPPAEDDVQLPPYAVPPCPADMEHQHTLADMSVDSAQHGSLVPCDSLALYLQKSTTMAVCHLSKSMEPQTQRPRQTLVSKATADVTHASVSTNSHLCLSPTSLSRPVPSSFNARLVLQNCSFPTPFLPIDEPAVNSLSCSTAGPEDIASVEDSVDDLLDLVFSSFIDLPPALSAYSNN